MTMRIKEHQIFLSAAARRPKVIGAVAPSSSKLAERLAAVIPDQGAPTVVELGPGTGAVSAAIRRRLPPGGRHLAVELDPAMLSYLTEQRSWLTVLPGDAAELATLLSGVNVRQVDAVISGLPWSVFPAQRQEQVMDAICQVLAPDGAFTTIGYLHALRLPGARRFRALLERRFDEVLMTSAVWQNLPPALVYVCRRVIPHA